MHVFFLRYIILLKVLPYQLVYICVLIVLHNFQRQNRQFLTSYHSLQVSEF